SNKIPPKIYTCYKNSFNNDDRFFQYRLDYDFISNQILSILREDNAIIKEHHFWFPKIIESSNNTLPHNLK
ncbi:PurR family transcriptional regulator, partial [Mannheimia haemolytica]